MPNVLAGGVIGIGNTSWTTVIGSALGWGVVWLVWSWIRKSPWLVEQIHKGMVIKNWSESRAIITALQIEYVTSVLTALPIASVVFLI